ncbi:PAS domain-containing protein [Sorangium sp. So ce1389]|uniref:PAS domain-containing protein n=1 Tax=Sorangium sp. So ce1389 TaxID=3133336 RepID=UPI003F5F866D
MAQSAGPALDFERFFELSTDFLFVLDRDARLRRINSAFRDIIGDPEGEVEHRDFPELLHTDDRESARSELQRLLKAGGAARLEASLLDRSQRFRTVSFTLHASAGEASVYGAGRELTLGPGADAAAWRSAALLQKIQSTAKVGGWELDCRTLELLWTEEVYRIHELPLGQKPSLENAIEYYAPESVPLIRSAVEACMQRGEPYDLELQLITGKGRRVWVRAAGGALWEQGKVARIYGCFQDIEEVKRRELDLAEKLAIIEQQRTAIQSMSTPIIRVWDEVLALPVVGNLDSARAQDMTQHLLDEVARSNATHVILDLTGVETVDEATADHLVRIVRAIRLLGAKSIVTGIRPQVAQLFVTLGAGLAGTTTLSNLRDAIKVCMRASAQVPPAAMSR